MLDLDQDLSFRPVQSSAPSTLTPAQIDHYNREGYVTGLTAFDPETACANSAYFDRLLASLPGDGAYAINCYQARAAGIWDICTTPRILDHVQDIIGPNVICWASHFFCKMPGDPKAVPWHQDAAFWALAPSRSVTVWLAIDDADAENAAMEFIPRTHNKGQLKWQASGPGTVLDKELVGAEDMGDPVVNALRAGQFSLHADMLAHGSKPNASDRRRCGLTLRYCPPEVRITDPSWAKGIEPIMCRGTDPEGYWQHHARPVGNDVSAANSPRNLGGN